MWRTMPDEITDVLWEGPLEPATEEAVRSLDRELRQRGRQTYRDPVRDLPIVQIGEPEIWTLAQFCAPYPVPPLLRAKKDEADYFIVEFRCSFRPIHDESEVEWAGFMAELLPEDGLQPLVADLYPVEVTRDVKRNVKVTLGPTLKFKEVEVGLGEVEFGMEYNQLQPEISGAGAGERIASWHYTATQGASIQGAKFMHALVKAPKEMQCGRAALDLSADVQVRGSSLATLVFTQDEVRRHRLTVRLWGDAA